ncbi:MAG: DUF58 domain-containing protein [Clostridiales bacterium]|nr:DUF58 domain-containing protein [Clostridiales bacterium]
MNARTVGALLGMAALLVTGLSTGVRVYYLLFGVLASMLLIALVSTVWALATLKVSISTDVNRATRGDRMGLVFTVRHLSFMPVAYIGIEMDVPSQVTGTHEVTVRAAALKRRTFRQVLLCPHRGVYQIGLRRASAEDVFGLIRLSKRMKSSNAILEVALRDRKADAMALGNVDDGPMYFSRSTEDTASPSDVRAWQNGDSLKKVHWKLSMRRRQVLVRTYEESARPDTLILPDLSPIPALRDQQLTLEDEICESALSIARAQLEAGYPVRMPLTCSVPMELSAHFMADFAPFGDALMRVPFDSATPYEQVLMMMTPRLQRTGGAVLITARLTTRVADMALKLRQSGVRVRLVWISEDVRDQSLSMLERLKMDGVEVQVRNLREG